MGFRTSVARSTLADANESRDWRIFADFAQTLIATARGLYGSEPMGVDLEQSLYALDSTTIDLCLALFPWSEFRRRKAAVKMHTLLDLRGNIPAFVHITGVRSDQTVILSSSWSAAAYPDPLRRVNYFDAETKKRLKFLTNNFTLPAHTIAQIYKQRWQVELFFKWIKQHLRIKAFYGTSENAVKTQIWVAVSVYVLVARVRKQLGLEASLYQILQILSRTLFERTPILRALQTSDWDEDSAENRNQVILFDF
jgi:IS4 transposase